MTGETVGWRGDGSGSFPDASPPTEWGPETRVLWKTELPDWGNAGPILVGDRIFVGAEPTDLVCLNAVDGEILWRASNTYLDELPPEEAEQARKMRDDAENTRKEIKQLEAERNKTKKKLQPVNTLRTGIANLERVLALHDDFEGIEKKLEDITARIEMAEIDSQSAPDDTKKKEKLKSLRDEKSLHENVDLVSERIAQKKKELDALAEEEKAHLASVDKLNGEIKDLKDNKLPDLTRYDLPRKHGATGYSSCTATSDGKDVFVVRGNGMVACYALDGERQWIRFIAKPTHGHGHSASPLLSDEHLIVHLTDLMALDRKTGETVWETKDAPVSFGSPVLARIGEEQVVVTPGGDIVKASDGTLLASKLSKLAYCAPIAADGTAYFIQRGGKAIRLPDAIGEEFKTELAWTADEIQGDRYYGSPVLLDGLIYAVNQKSHFTVIDAATGKSVYDKKLDLGGTVYPSITHAGGYLYVSGENGVTAVLAPGREFKEIARNKLEKFRGCPVFSGKRMYVRGMKHLYCIGG
jgi:outer membrane protein assembly factor BamB